MLKDYVDYQSGTLIQRLETVDTNKGQNYQIYDQTMLEYDLGQNLKPNHEPKTIALQDTSRATYVQRGDIVFNMMSGACAMVSSEHEGAILPYNYTRIDITSNELDPRFLAYWFQMAHEAHVQLQQYMQGGTQIKKITHRQLKDLHITVPTMQKQQLIGQIGVKRRQLALLEQQKDKLMQQFLSASLFKEEQ
ncbi:restriction endonuclease subunit S [Staphylococcus saprophyticus]|uniref:restriction endonuclease subunit S n=1 Tax=Staphylococcus saprophyticus TaxID=29385 RepID=UPI001D17174E|nr:restriction endonuclease subunit S [Staphylococcus saprophyticus]MCC4221699.1 restriction endonuclease subunit S [Staphylococcus saprophyticus]